MRRTLAVFALAVVLLVGVFAIGQRTNTRAQDASPSPAASTSLAGHPLVGAWMIIGPTGNNETIDAFTSDGVVMSSGRPGGNTPRGGVGFGSWEATGPRSAAMTFVIPVEFQGQPINLTFRGVATVDESGDHFSADVSILVASPDGQFVLGHLTNHVTANRIHVEPVEAGLIGPELSGFVLGGTPPASASPTN